MKGLISDPALYLAKTNGYIKSSVGFPINIDVTPALPGARHPTVEPGFFGARITPSSATARPAAWPMIPSMPAIDDVISRGRWNEGGET